MLEALKFKKMNNLKRRINKKEGFTLVELLVVIAIIAILSVTAYVALGGQTEKARNSKRQSDLASIQSALEIYAIGNNNKYPAALSTLVDEGIISEIIPDPASNDSETYAYAYATGNNDRKYQLGAVQVDEDGNYTAYVIGNGDALITAEVGSDCAGNSNKMVDDTDCVPTGYQP